MKFARATKAVWRIGLATSSKTALRGNYFRWQEVSGRLAARRLGGEARRVELRGVRGIDGPGANDRQSVHDAGAGVGFRPAAP
jgi:hypothetical protein